MTEIIVALITGGITLIGVVISNMSSNHKIQSQLQTSQAVTDTKIDELTREVREHNGFAQKIPTIEAQITDINRRLENLENYHK